MSAEDFAPLTQEKLSAGLSEIKPLVGGGGYAFTRLDCKEKGLNHLGNKLEDCSHLRYINLSTNQISDITAVSKLKHLLSLQADNNAINSIDCLAIGATEEDPGTDLPWCQRMDLSSNKLTALPSLAALGRLRFLRLETNEIASLDAFGGHPTIEELEVQGNKLTSFQGLGCCAKLRILDASGNAIESLKGLDAPSLTKLNVSKNSLATLEHISGAPALVDVDISGNKLESEVPDSLPTEFQRIGSDLPCLRILAMADNGVGSLKSELIICAPQVTVIDAEPVVADDRGAADERHEEIKKAEEARQEAAREAEAEAARLKAEEEAAAAEAAAAEAAAAE